MGSIAYLAPHELQALYAVKQALAQTDQLVDFRLFGSKARGDAAEESDIDIMVELEELTPALSNTVFDIVFDANLQYGVFISTVLFSRQELEEGPMSVSPLYKSIERDGVRL